MLALDESLAHLVEQDADRVDVVGDADVDDGEPKELDAGVRHRLRKAWHAEHVELVVLDQQDERVDGVGAAQPADVVGEVPPMMATGLRDRACRV